jgi:hypothetical protein
MLFFSSQLIIFSAKSKEASISGVYFSNIKKIGKVYMFSFVVLKDMLNDLHMDFKKFFNYLSVKHEVLQDGVERYIYTGTNIQVVEYHFPPNRTFPEHKHDETEQMGYLISGKMGFRIGGEEKVLMPGEYYHARLGCCIAPGQWRKPRYYSIFFLHPERISLRFKKRLPQRNGIVYAFSLRQPSLEIFMYYSVICFLIRFSADPALNHSN